MMGVSAAVSVAGTIAAAKAQANMAKGQQAGILDNTGAADAAAQFRNLQQSQANSQQMSDRAVAAIRERGRIAAAASEGMGSGTTDRLMNESNLAEGVDQATLAAGEQAGQQSTQIERDSIARHANQDLASVRYPTRLGTGLQIVGDVAQGAGRIYDYNARNYAQPKG